MNKLSKEKKQQIIAVLVGALVVVGCLWYFVIDGQRQGIASRTRDIDDTEKKIDAAKKLKDKKDKAEADLAATSKKLDAIQDTMASGDLFFWVINTVSKEFKAGPPPHKVDIKNITKEELIRVGILPDFPYQGAKYIVTGAAYYHDLGRFVAEFENTFPYFHIRNLDLAPNEGGTPDEAEKLSFRLEIVALVKPVPAAQPEKK
jgi:hypothetical protein